MAATVSGFQLLLVHPMVVFHIEEKTPPRRDPRYLARSGTPLSTLSRAIDGLYTDWT